MYLISTMAERIQLIAGQIASVVADTGSNLASHSKEIAIQHPVASVAVGTGAALAAAPWLLTIPALTMAGFGSPGIASGKLDIKHQSPYYIVSLFKQT